ncbi:hypothetical protein VPH35_039464 [Triticum aestivum]|uniref:Uncharacterized protein n=1 Tax=Aegilops tauschii TaxID=37682 RepID=M8CY49_AEGTA
MRSGRSLLPPSLSLSLYPVLVSPMQYQVRVILAFFKVLVNNYNDITHHFLYYIYVHLDLAKAKKSASQPQLMHQLGTKVHPLIISIYAACQPHGDQTDEEKEAARKKQFHNSGKSFCWRASPAASPASTSR